MQNKFSARVLTKIMDARQWNQGELSKRSGMAQSLISNQLAGQRPIRDKHLVRYLNGLDHNERPILLAAWLRDNLSPESVQDVLALERVQEETSVYRLRNEVATWQPKLEPEDRQMLSWWAEQIANGDVDLRDVLRAITRKAGYPKSWH